MKLVMDRASVFEATGPTPASHIRVKIGADAEGQITAAEAWLAYEAGAFPGSPINPGCMCVFACYDVPNGRIDGYDVVVNKPRTNAYRAPGATNAAMATETVIDEICEQLQIDPLEFRAKTRPAKGRGGSTGRFMPASAWPKRSPPSATANSGNRPWADPAAGAASPRDSGSTRDFNPRQPRP